MNSDWIVGFVDGDGHFGFSKDEKTFYFVVSQDKRSVSVLYEMKAFFSCGHVHRAGNNMREYKVSSKQHLLEKIVPFFRKNVLQTSKREAFEKFVTKLDPSIVFDSTLTSHPQKHKLSMDWLAGFVDAEGCFVCTILNKTIRPQFILGLSPMDHTILDRIQTELSYGVRYTRKSTIEVFQLSSNKTMCAFARDCLITKAFKDRLKTYKRIRARKWCKILFLMEQKQHKTVRGFELIQKLYKNF